MDVDAYIARAWRAVEAAEVPADLREVAFKEALVFLRVSDPSVHASEATGSQESSKPDSGNDLAEPSTSQAQQWQRLADESGVTVQDLKDVLQIDGDKVRITAPTRSLGSNVAGQARAAIALVAGARAIALGEDPVSAEEVREEVERKRVYQNKHFAAKHLGPLKGFNAGANRNQIVLTSRWVDEFVAAVQQARGSAAA